MNCPVCDSTRMREVEKNGILIDVCPSCKGVWLDRGELEKLMSDVREVQQDYNEWYYGEQEDRKPYYGESQDRKPHYDSYPQGHPKYRKRKRSVLDVFGDLFD